MDSRIREFIFEYFELPKEIIYEPRRIYVSGNLRRSNYTVSFNNDHYILTKGGLHVLSGNNSSEVLQKLKMEVSEISKNTSSNIKQEK